MFGTLRELGALFFWGVGEGRGEEGAGEGEGSGGRGGEGRGIKVAYLGGSQVVPGVLKSTLFNQ